jgi:predicted esterase
VRFWLLAALSVTPLLAPTWGAATLERATLNRTQATAASAAAEQPADEPRWCAAELEELEDHACVGGDLARADTLVLFLHGVIQPDTTWQWAQQRAAVRGAVRHHAVALAPRGRRGRGPRGMEDWWTWPTGEAARLALEPELLAEWSAARSTLERRRERPFQRLLVFGFSNGAYYATSLAVRALLPAQGFGIFAGGAAPEYIRRSAQNQRARPPIYVGWGSKDRARKDPASLAALLRRLRWPTAGKERRGVGHSMTDAMVDEAFALFDRKK